MSIQFQYYDTVAHGYTGILTAASSVLVTDSSGVPSFSATPPALTGTATNDSATSGKIGEYLTGQTNTVSMTSTTPVTITSVSLTAGDWDVEGTLQYNAAGGTLMTDAKAGINTTTNVLPTAMTAGGYVTVDAPAAAGVGHTLPTGNQRVSLAATTTVYLVGQATFTISTMTGSGFIRARRMR